MTEIPNNITELREAMGWSKADLSRKMSVSKTTIQKWEDGTITPRKDKLEKLSELFGVDLLYLMGYDNETLKKILKISSENTSQLMKKLGLNPNNFEQLQSLNKSATLIKNLSHENNEKWLEYGNLLLKSQSKK